MRQITLDELFTAMPAVQRYSSREPRPKTHRHIFCNGCYDPKDPPARVLSFCGREIDGERPRWLDGENCLDCVTAYGQTCQRCGT